MSDAIEITTEKYLNRVLSSSTLEEMKDLMEQWNVELTELKYDNK